MASPVRAMILLFVSAVLAGPGLGPSPTPWFDPTETVGYQATGPESLVAYYRDGLALPRSVQTTDLDQDGTPDLVVSYDTPSGPAIGFVRGNMGAVYPHHPDANGSTEAFHGPIRLSSIPTRGDFLAPGDHDADGSPDMLVGASDRPPGEGSAVDSGGAQGAHNGTVWPV